MAWSCDGRGVGGLGQCEGAVGGYWEMGEASREEDGRIPRTNMACIRRTLLLVILFSSYRKSVQVVSRHVVDGMDRFVGCLLGNSAHLLQN